MAAITAEIAADVASGRTAVARPDLAGLPVAFLAARNALAPSPLIG